MAPGMVLLAQYTLPVMPVGYESTMYLSYVPPGTPRERSASPRHGRWVRGCTARRKAMALLPAGVRAWAVCLLTCLPQFLDLKAGTSAHLRESLPRLSQWMCVNFSE